MREQKRMQGKRVLATGAGTAIGRGIAEAFAEEGATVAFHYSRSSAGARAAVDEIPSAGGKEETFQADFADVEQAAKDNVPTGIVGLPSDITHVAIVLASDEARYIVGQTIVADGGQNACVPRGPAFKDSFGFTWGQAYTPWL